MRRPLGLTTSSRYSFLRGRGRMTARQFLTACFALVVVVLSVVAATPDKADAATSGTLTFQARLLQTSGALVADGTYNVEFKLYDAASGGTTLWTETRTGADRVTVKNGYLYANLGSVTAFPGTIDWDQELWLTMNVGGTGSPTWDGEMNPRFKITAVPYAFAASKLQARSGANSLKVVLPTPANGNNTITVPDESGTLCLQNSSSCGFATGNGAAFLQGGNAPTGTVALGTTNAQALQIITDNLVRIDVQADGDIVVGSNLLTVSTTGTNVQVGSTTTDSTGVLFGLDSYDQAGDPTGFNGAMYYNTVNNRFRCFENGSWVDCIGGGASSSTSANFISGLQNVPANSNNLPAETLVFTSATGVSNTAGVTGFTAPADGSFRSCMVKNNAAITAGTISVRWRVNGVSVGGPACTMNSTNNRQTASVLNPGDVTFSAGDTISVAFDTSNTFLPTGTNDFTIYWGVDYRAQGSGGSASFSLQDVYDNSIAANILTANNKDLTISLADTAIDSNFVVDILSGSTGKFIVQNSGVDAFSVDKNGDVVTSGGLTLSNTTSTAAGTIRWTGLDFEGFDGSTWISLTGGGSGGGSISSNYVTVIKQANEIVNGSNVVQDDDELQFNIGPNEEWTYRYVIQANSSTTADLRFTINGPAGSTCRTAYADVEGATSNGQYACGTNTANIPGNGAVDLYEITGSVVNGATPGVIKLSWAQNVATASDTTVYAGSYLTAFRALGPGAAGQPFAQSGNSFGTTAVLGTNDTQDLSFETDGTVRMTLSSSGALAIAGTTTLGGNLLASGAATGTTGTTSGTGTNTTTLTLSSDAFALNDVVFIDNAGQDYYTRIVADPGTGSYTVSPAVTFENARTVTKYTVQNIGATATDYTTQANRFFEGYFLGGVVIGTNSTRISDGSIQSSTELNLQTNGNALNVGGDVNIAGTITGDGAGITNIDGAAITSGSIADGSLSSNVALLSGTQSFTGLKTFGAGATITAGQAFTINNEGFTDLTGSGLAISGGALNVQYGALAGTSVQGNTTLTCPSGSGNLTGGGDIITLGSGGTCGAISITNSPSFTTSVTSPVFTGSGAVTLSSGGSSNLTLDSAGNVLLLADATARRSGSLDFELNAAATTTFTITNTDGTNVANLAVEGAVTASGFSGDGASLTSLNGTNISSGTIADARLSTNVALLSGTQTFSGAKTFGSGLSIGASQTLTINSDSFSDLTGTGLSISGGALGIDATYANSTFVKVGGNTLGGLLTLGTTDANGISFVTGGTDKLRILSGGNIGINNTNPGNKFNVNTPGTAVASTEMVIAATAAGNKGLVIQGATSQSANFLEVQNNSGNALAAIDANGQLLLGRASAATGTIVLSNSTNGNTTTLASGVATGTRTITLPDESGTICLSNSNNCGYVRLAAGAFQTDASNNDVIAINKTSATGNLMVLQRSGTGVFTIANNGALQIRATSTTGLDVQNGTGTSYFSVDTSGNVVRIGATAADGTGVLFVLDTKNTAGDPTGINGGSYYNSSLNKSRCFENGVWSDCMATRVLGETTLGAASNTISVTLSASTEYLRCRVDITGRSVANGVYLRFNSDAGAASYGWNEYDIINTAVGDAQDSSDSEIQLTGTDTSNIPASASLDITNFQNVQKIVDWSYSGVTGIGTNNRHYNGTGNWSNTTNQITTVQFITSTGTFNAGSHAWCEGRDIR